MCSLDSFKHLKLDRYHRDILEGELKMWHTTYLPCGTHVVDIGAGNGETAQFFLNHGAEHVLCVEPDDELLKSNFGTDPRVTIWPFPMTFLKSDCEGGEKNATIETHFPYRVRVLQDGFPFPSRGATIRIEEYWGSPIRKLFRLVAVKVLRRAW